MKSRRLIALAFICILSTPAHAGSLGMVTGPKVGTYIALGNDISKVATRGGMEVDVKESKGSIDNIRRITSQEPVSLGIVQSDVLGFLSHSQNPDSVRVARKLRMVFPLNNEEIHVLARKDIATFKDLNGKRVVVGTEGSGNMITSINLLTLQGVKPAKMYQTAPAEGVVAVLNGQADAVIFVGGKPVKMFKNLEEVGKIKSGTDAGKLEQVHLIPLDDPKLLAEYASAKLTGEDYNYIKEPVNTVAVTSVLMTYDFSDKGNQHHKQRCKDLAQLSKIIRGNIDWLRENGHPKWREVNLDANVGYWKKDNCSWSEAAMVNEPSSLEKELIGVIRSGQATNSGQQAQP